MFRVRGSGGGVNYLVNGRVHIANRSLPYSWAQNVTYRVTYMGGGGGSR